MEKLFKVHESDIRDSQKSSLGWSWLERWMEARPWDSQNTWDFNEHASMKSAASHTISAGELAKSFTQYNLNQIDHKSSSASTKSTCLANHDHSLSSPISKVPSSSSSLARKTLKGNAGSSCVHDDSWSITSVKSVRYRRHSIAGSLVFDYESLVTSPTYPSCKPPTKSANATRSGLSSPSDIEKMGHLRRDRLVLQRGFFLSLVLSVFQGDIILDLLRLISTL